MTRATLNERAEKMKVSIKDTAEKSKETIREIIGANTKFINDALDYNKKVVDAVKLKLNQQDIEDTLTDSLKSTFRKSVELAEDALDSIINSYSRQMEMNVDFNTKLIDIVKDTNSSTPEKLLNLIKENFEASRKLSVKNTQEIVDAYNKHTNLAVNFNQKIGENINTHIEYLFSLQSKGMNRFSELASEWWKQTEQKVKL